MAMKLSNIVLGRPLPDQWSNPASFRFWIRVFVLYLPALVALIAAGPFEVAAHILFIAYLTGFAVFSALIYKKFFGTIGYFYTFFIVSFLIVSTFVIGISRDPEDLAVLVYLFTYYALPIFLFEVALFIYRIRSFKHTG